jgi:sec-independent protein translocase protein TatA
MFESLMMFIGGPELIILVVIIGVLIFGAAKIPQLAKTFGKAKSEYKKGEIEGDNELKDFKEKKKNETASKKGAMPKGF